MPTIQVALAMVAMAGATQGSSHLDAGLCPYQQVRHAVSEAIGNWSENYAFAKVIIGSDGRFGEVSPPSSSERGNGYIICHASYQLSKVGKIASMMSYLVGIPALTYRVSSNGGNYQIRLEDLPLQLDRSKVQVAELLSRFTINGRPYPEVVAENQARNGN